MSGSRQHPQAESYFDYAVEGATASYGAIGAERARLVRDRIQKLLAWPSWGNNWGNMPHRFQPISADLDLAETA